MKFHIKRNTRASDLVTEAGIPPPPFLYEHTDTVWGPELTRIVVSAWILSCLRGLKFVQVWLTNVNNACAGGRYQ